MFDSDKIVDMVERAHDASPLCPCGRHTIPVWRDGAMWLECSWFTTREHERLPRLVAQLVGLQHVHEHIVDVPGTRADLEAAAA